LSKTALEHINLFAKFVILKLVFFGLTPDIFIALLAQLFELAVLRFPQRLNHVVCFIELLAQVANNAVLVFFQVRSILLQIVHKASERLIFLNGASGLALTSLRQLSLTL